MKGTSEKRWRKFCQHMAPCNSKSLRGSLPFFSCYCLSHSQVAFIFYDIYMIKFYFLSFLRSIKDQFPASVKRQLYISTWLVLTGLKSLMSPAELAYNPHTQSYLQWYFQVALARRMKNHPGSIFFLWQLSGYLISSFLDAKIEIGIWMHKILWQGGQSFGDWQSLT